jgi:hypothetical protein
MGQAVSRLKGSESGQDKWYQRTLATNEVDGSTLLPCFSYTVDSWIRAMYVRRTRVCEEGSSIDV